MKEQHLTDLQEKLRQQYGLDEWTAHTLGDVYAQADPEDLERIQELDGDDHEIIAKIEAGFLFEAAAKTSWFQYLTSRAAMEREPLAKIMAQNIDNETGKAAAVRYLALDYFATWVQIALDDASSALQRQRIKADETGRDY